MPLTFSQKDGDVLKTLVDSNKEILEKEIQHLRELIDDRRDYSQEALEVSTKELHRRLEILNHENERILHVEDNFILKDVYEARHKEIVARIDTNAGRIGILEDWKSKSEGAASTSVIIANRAITVSVIFGILVALLTIVNIVTYALKP